MKLPTRSATGFRLCDIIRDDFNHTLIVVQCLGYVETNIRTHQTVRLLVQLAERVFTLGISEKTLFVFKLSGYLRCSHGSCSRDWGCQLLVHLHTSSNGAARASFA